MMASAVLAHTQILILNKPREYPNNTYRLKKTELLKTVPVCHTDLKAQYQQLSCEKKNIFKFTG